MAVHTALLLALLATAAALRTRQENLFANYGKVTMVEYEDDGHYTLNAVGEPDHNCTKCGSDQSSRTFTVTNSPVKNSDGTCLPFGNIGMALNGVAFFSPYSIVPAPALDCENTDSCMGHPNGEGVYHYHGDPKCLNDGRSGMVGIAFDGHPIYRQYIGTNNDTLPTTAQMTSEMGITLDECHGATVQNQYRYYITSDFPYIFGCFRGTPSDDVNINGPNCYSADLSKITLNDCDPVTFSTKRSLSGTDSDVSLIQHIRGSHSGGARSKRIGGSGSTNAKHISASANQAADRRTRVLKMLLALLDEK